MLDRSSILFIMHCVVIVITVFICSLVSLFYFKIVIQLFGYTKRKCEIELR